MRAARIGGTVLVLGLVALGSTGCGDDADDPIELSTSCGDWRDHDEADRTDALATLGPENGWPEGAEDDALAQVDAICDETTRATLVDVFAAAARGQLDAATALVETFCRQTQIYVEAVEEQAEDLDTVDSEELSAQGTELSNAAIRLQPVDGENEQRVEACSQQAADAALLLAPGS